MEEIKKVWRVHITGSNNRGNDGAYRDETFYSNETVAQTAFMQKVLKIMDTNAVWSNAYDENGNANEGYRCCITSDFVYLVYTGKSEGKYKRRWRRTLFATLEELPVMSDVPEIVEVKTNMDK